MENNTTGSSLTGSIPTDIKQVSLYAYFGELGIFNDDIPGHTFYQLGLLDAISEKYNDKIFDFHNYIHDEPNITNPFYPSDEIGDIFKTYTARLINTYQIPYNLVIEKIKNHEYNTLFLKARFRNLSTLTKKFKDAAHFEEIIEVALASGYSPCSIVIIDTDLSLSQDFIKHINDLGLIHEIPSVTMPGIGNSFLKECMQVHARHANSEIMREPSIVYYGNLSFENYKEGHSKNIIITDIIKASDSLKMFNGDKFTLNVFTKRTATLDNLISSLENGYIYSRSDRENIWQALSTSLISINVSKDLYLDRGFIPARVYESVIFGIIPVSYKQSFNPAMEFNTIAEFFEICKFLYECSSLDYYKVLCSIADHF